MTDHCTLWPDGNYGKCCEAHDIAYALGGSQESRLTADKALRECVKSKGRPITAWLMYCGIRLFGAPWWPTPLRWGRSQGYLKSCSYDKQSCS